MKATIRDCLALEAFRQCVVVAGEKNLDNRVKRVSVMDALTVREAILYNARAEELVLTSFSGMNWHGEMWPVWSYFSVEMLLTLTAIKRWQTLLRKHAFPL